MRANKKCRSAVMSALFVIGLLSLSSLLAAQTANSSPACPHAGPPKWSLQVDRVNPGDVDLASSFQLAIYENLLTEMDKTKCFKQVLRSGDRNASAVPDLLILKTAVQKYSAGNETERAVTTVAGATKLNVRSQLCAPDGRVVLELVVEGDVHFFGSNLRATHNLARNIAKKIKQSNLLPPSPPAAGAE